MSPDIAKEFAKYDQEPSKWVKQYEFNHSITKQVCVCVRVCASARHAVSGAAPIHYHNSVFNMTTDVVNNEWKHGKSCKQIRLV